ncbi:phosphoribosyltransferase family protein [Paenibacillus solisilvae]|uniref:Phosphoribosyltransferase family protein n=1 Tax=Paenibacillus solisilvae TaxID=2486751 RepID=A0ABW0W8W4_9BACL
MNNSTLSDSCPSTHKHTFPILGNLQVTVTPTYNPFNLPLDVLFSMAARINKKRSFLFVSKVLGKHIPVHPYTSMLSGASLALLLYRELIGREYQAQTDALLEQAIQGLRNPELAEEAYKKIIHAQLSSPVPLQFIGFAETATALGHSVYEVFADQAAYIHTTREDLPALTSVINFDEEHSHAVAHRCYARHSGLLTGEEIVVLVDDEMTTGKTSLNIIRDMQAKFPRSTYFVASLLDWRTEQDEAAYAALEAELGIAIKPLCLLKGSMSIEGAVELKPSDTALPDGRGDARVNVLHMGEIFPSIEAASVDSAGQLNDSPYLLATGRFGMRSQDNAAAAVQITEIARRLRGMRTREDSHTLVMGTGEFMYVPMRIAAEMGGNVVYQSTTRSPIHPSRGPEYGIQSGYGYPSPDDPGTRNFVYNVDPDQYEDIFILFERDVPPERAEPFINLVKKLAKVNVHLIFFTGKRHDWKVLNA